MQPFQGKLSLNTIRGVCLDFRGEFQAGGMQWGMLSVLMIFQVMWLPEVTWEVNVDRGKV